MSLITILLYKRVYEYILSTLNIEFPLSRSTKVKNYTENANQKKKKTSFSFKSYNPKTTHSISTVGLRQIDHFHPPYLI